MDKNMCISVMEIRDLLLKTLACEDADIDESEQTFKTYGYEGSTADLYRLAEGLAIKQGMIDNKIKPKKAAWGGGSYKLNSGLNTNFSEEDIKNLYSQFYVLLTQGVLAPDAPNDFSDMLPYFHVTAYGLECLKSKEILPYDIDGYYGRVAAVKGITEWVKFYIAQALKCYNANCLESSMIMLGLANEQIIEELLSGIHRVLLDDKKQKFEQQLKQDGKTASAKYRIYLDYYNQIKSDITDSSMDRAKAEMDRLAQQVYTNFIRIIRNEMAHPNDLRMDRTEVLMTFISFVKYCETQYKFIKYYNEIQSKETSE